jgi:phytoene dehydrogenase-like protein
MRTADVVVVGGGCVGASAAYHLAAAGVGEVLLLERQDALGTGATGACAGGFRHQFGSEINVRLSLASVPSEARGALIQCFAQPLRLDFTVTPTSSVGLHMDAKDFIFIDGRPNLDNVQFIREGGTNSQIQAIYVGWGG